MNHDHISLPAVTRYETERRALTNHRVVRDGSHWLCRFCCRTWPFPAPVPSSAGTCVPRDWRAS